jgi:REP element-mobilizing transposase RayT
MDYKLRYRRKLPHFQPQDGVFFITFRLAFDIPAKYLTAYQQFQGRLAAYFETLEDQTQAPATKKKKLFAYMDEVYNQCPTDVSLTANPHAAQVISEKLVSLNDNMYYLYAFTIMPNHVHLLIKPNTADGKPYPISEIMHHIKGSTSRMVNLVLKREGRLWLPEYFDYWVRSQEELFNIIDYIRQNPVQAHLAKTPEAWTYTWINPDFLA